MSKFRSLLFTLSLYLAFFASGAASLIAEVTWNRMLIVVVGNSLSATAMIIAIFMGGLGLGSYLGGKVFSRRGISLLPYLILELTIGIYVLLSPALFDLLTGLFSTLASGGADRAGLTLIRVLVTTIALLLPAFFMGATFPAIIAGTMSASAERRSARTCYLYSINTLGAAVGCFAAGYHLLLEFGVRSTLVCAFGLYLLAALCALAARAAGGPVTVTAAVETELIAAPHPLRRYLGLATFGIGFVALGYQVMLTRLAILYLGNSISVFPLVLTGFLLGTGLSAILGTWLYGLLGRAGRNADQLFGFTALAAGIVILLTPYLLLTDWVVDIGSFARLADASARNPLPILGLIMAPTILVGALLPIAIRMLHSGSRGEATRGAATLYSLNTAGGLLGAGLANHFLVPLVGTQVVFVILATLCAALGLLHLVALGRGPKRWSLSLAGAVVLAALLILILPDMAQLYAAKIAKSTRARSTQVRLVAEGRAATVTVIDQSDPIKGDYRDMYLNGVEEASTRYWHVQLFKLLGILPVLIHESEQPKEVMVVAFGAGITAGSVLASDQVASMDVVDLNPDIEGINDLFTEVNGNVFHQERFHFQNADGRNYLVTCNKQYDLIIGDSTHPRAYDSWILYTDEYYRAVKSHLLPGGIFAQWVPVLGSMQGDLFRIHLNTFRNVFPHATFWYVYGSDQAFFLATPEPLAIDAEQLQEKLDRLPSWFNAEYYQIDTVERVAGFFWLDDAATVRMIGDETRINTDDFHYFDKQSAVRPLPPQQRLLFFQASPLPYITGLDTNRMTAIQKQQAVAFLLARYAFLGTRDDLHRAYCFMPENGNARYWIERVHAGHRPDPELFCQSEELKRYRRLVAKRPDDYLALNALSSLLTEEGDLNEALSFADRAVALAPNNGMILDTRGWILFLLNRHPEALIMLERAVLSLPTHPIVLYHMGATLHALGKDPEAREKIESALHASPNFTYATEARRILSEMDQ